MSENKKCYVTSDNSIFLDKEDAEKHEYDLIAEGILDNPFAVFMMYKIFKINNEEELNALMFYDPETMVFSLPDYYEFPLLLTESDYNGICEYEMIEDTIDWHDSIADALNDYLSIKDQE